VVKERIPAIEEPEFCDDDLSVINDLCEPGLWETYRDTALTLHKLMADDCPIGCMIVYSMITKNPENPDFYYTKQKRTPKSPSTDKWLVKARRGKFLRKMEIDERKLVDAIDRMLWHSGLHARLWKWAYHAYMRAKRVLDTMDYMPQE
jgi:hypothetical protein